MQLLKLIWNHAPSRSRLLWLTLAMGFFNYFILESLLTAIRHGVVDGLTFSLLAMFATGVTLRIYLMELTSERILDSLGELLFHKLERFTSLIRTADIAAFERLSKSHVLGSVTRDLTILTEAFIMVPARIDALVRLIIGIVLLAFLSELMCAATLVMVIVIFLLFYGQQAKAGAATKAEAQTDDFRLFSDLLHGHSAIKLNQRRGEELLAELDSNSARIIEEGTTASRTSVNRRLVIDLAMFGLMGINLFLAPFLSFWHLEVVVEVNMVLLWMLGLLTSLASGFVELARSEAALKRFADRETELEDCQPPIHPDATSFAGWLPPAFNQIHLRQAAFTYWSPRRQQTFTVGPIDLDIRQGDTLVLTGGNGAGKSTLLQMLAGLYRLESGNLKVDGRSIDEIHLQSYRNLFAMVGGDLRIIDDRGVDATTAERLNAELERLQLSKKCHFEAGRFVGAGLSKGESKRLALALAVVRDRPILAFDEWTSDQSPQFRDWFYHEFIPDQQNQGKTILLVSHRSQAKEISGRIVKMDAGRIVEVTG